MLTGIGMVADVPSLRLATSESVSADCPTGTAPSGNGNAPCHWPGPVRARPIVCVPICSFTAVAFDVVTALIRTGVPFETPMKGVTVRSIKPSLLDLNIYKNRETLAGSTEYE
jgi:hypothetical protein